LDERPSSRQIIGRIEKDWTQNETNAESLADFSTACRAFAYAGGYRRRRAPSTGRAAKGL
jgi:hypothetical protein